MAIPDRSRIKEALVDFIKTNGGSNFSTTPRAAYRGLAAKFNLTKEDLEKERDWELMWPNEVRWARQELVSEGVLLPREQSGYGVWQVNPNKNSGNVSPSKNTSPVQKTEMEQLYEDLDDEGVFDPKSVSDAKDVILRSIVQRRGQQDFRRLLLREYDNKCSVTGETCTAALEAAHIVPYAGDQTNHIQNGLLLRADLHTLFDLYLIAIDSSYCVRIAPSLQTTGYKSFNGKTLLLPTALASHPSKQALELHRSHCEF